MSAFVAVLDDQTRILLVLALGLGSRELRRNGTAVTPAFRAVVAALAAGSGPERTPLPAAVEQGEPALMSYAQTGRRLGVSERTVRRLVASGDLPAVRLGRRVLLRQADVDEFAQVRRVG